MGQDRKVKMK